MGREATILNSCSKRRQKRDAAQFSIFGKKSYTRHLAATWRQHQRQGRSNKIKEEKCEVKSRYCRNSIFNLIYPCVTGRSQRKPQRRRQTNGRQSKTRGNESGTATILNSCSKRRQKEDAAQFFLCIMGQERHTRHLAAIWRQQGTIGNYRDALTSRIVKGGINGRGYRNSNAEENKRRDAVHFYVYFLFKSCTGVP